MAKKGRTGRGSSNCKCWMKDSKVNNRKDMNMGDRRVSGVGFLRGTL
jgi:hypothetical protein